MYVRRRWVEDSVSVSPPLLSLFCKFFFFFSLPVNFYYSTPTSISAFSPHHYSSSSYCPRSATQATTFAHRSNMAVDGEFPPQYFLKVSFYVNSRNYSDLYLHFCYFDPSCFRRSTTSRNISWEISRKLFTFFVMEKKFATLCQNCCSLLRFLLISHRSSFSRLFFRYTQMLLIIFSPLI